MLSGKSKLVTNYNGESQIFEKNYYCERKVKKIVGWEEERRRETLQIVEWKIMGRKYCKK